MRKALRLRLRRHHRRYHTLAYMTLSLLAFAVAMPIVMSTRKQANVFRPPAHLAEARDSYILSTPLNLVPAAGLTLDAGSISIAPSQAASARTGEAILTLLTGGNAKLILEGAAFTFATPPNAVAETTPADGLQPLLMSLMEQRFETLSIHHGKVTIRRAGAGTLELIDLNAEVSLRRKGTVAAKGTFEYRGETMSFDVTFALGDRKSMSRLPFRADIKGDLMEASVEGRASLGNGIQVTSQNAMVAFSDLRRAVNWLGFGWPDGPGLRKLRISGHLDWVDLDAAFQSATLEVDGNLANGNLLVRFSGPRPSVEATLAMAQIDLTPYLAPRPADDTRLAVQAKQAASATPAGEFSLPIVGNLDADLRVSAERVTLADLRLGRIAAVLSMKSGRLFADVADLEIDDTARLTGQIGIDMTQPEPRYTLRGKATGLDAARISAALTGHRTLGGLADLVFDLSATGGTAAALTSTLAGKATFKMPAGGQLGLDLADLYSAVLTKSPTIGWGDAAGGYTALDSFSGRFDISAGQATPEQLAGRSGLALYSGTGTINLPARTLDFTLTRALAVTQAGNGRDPGVSIVLRGPWREPAMQPAGRAAAPPPTPPAPNAATAPPKPGRT